MALVLKKQLNFDVCDMINKIVINDYRKKIIDDYEDVLKNNDNSDNDNYYNLQIFIQFKTLCSRYGQESIVIINLDKDEAYKKFQIIKDYMDLNIHNEIVGIYMEMVSSFIDGSGYYVMGYEDNADLIKYYEVPNYEELCKEYGEDWYCNYTEFNEEDFLECYNEIKELYDNDELEFYDCGKDENLIIFNKW